MGEEHRCPQCGAVLPAHAPHGIYPGCLLKRGLETPTAASQGGSGPAETPYVPPTPAELAPSFPELEILELIGRGGMGVVYKARQKGLDRLVALKILSPTIGQDPAFAERFAREARAMAMLSHPHIVAVHDFGQTPLAPSGRGAGGEGSLYYFLMEFVDGVNLRRLLETGTLAPKAGLAIVPQICDALQYAHDAGVVHRDIKPENILLDKQGRVKIADFGIAKLVGRPPQDHALTGAGQVVGTPHYMAPEQIEHPQEVDHRADIYSLGVVFYQMLTGELPIGRFAPPSQKVQIDVRLDEVVLRALEKEPDRRYQQASEIKTHVETIATTPPCPTSDTAGGSPASASGAGNANGPRSSAKRRHSQTGVVALALALCGPLIGIAVEPLDRPLAIPASVGAEVAALILGILAWSFSRAGRIAVIVVLLLPLLSSGTYIYAKMHAQAGEKSDAKASGTSERPSEPPRPANEERPAAEEVNIADHPGGPWIAKLPQGEAELVAIARCPSKGQPWWRPDGSLYTERPFGSSAPEPTRDATMDRREFAFRLPAGASLRVQGSEPHAVWGPVSSPTARGPQEYSFVAAALLRPTKVLTVRLEVASGDWTIVSKHAPADANSSQTPRVGDTEWTVAFDSAAETPDGTTVVTAAHTRTQQETRIVAIDKQGREHTQSGSAGVFVDNARELTARFRNLPLAQIKEFRLQTRAYRPVAFRNVALRPVESAPAQAVRPTGTSSAPAESGTSTNVRDEPP